MNQLTTLITEYLEHCRTQKRLDSKTLKAYRIDLTQFSVFVKSSIVVDTSSTRPRRILFLSIIHAADLKLPHSLSIWLKTL